MLLANLRTLMVPAAILAIWAVLAYLTISDYSPTQQIWLPNDRQDHRRIHNAHKIVHSQSNNGTQHSPPPPPPPPTTSATTTTTTSTAPPTTTTTTTSTITTTTTASTTTLTSAAISETSSTTNERTTTRIEVISDELSSSSSSVSVSTKSASSDVAAYGARLDSLGHVLDSRRVRANYTCASTCGPEAFAASPMQYMHESLFFRVFDAYTMMTPHNEMLMYVVGRQMFADWATAIVSDAKYGQFEEDARDGTNCARGDGDFDYEPYVKLEKATAAILENHKRLCATWYESTDDIVRDEDALARDGGIDALQRQCTPCAVDPRFTHVMACVVPADVARRSLALWQHRRRQKQREIDVMETVVEKQRAIHAAPGCDVEFRARSTLYAQIWIEPLPPHQWKTGMNLTGTPFEQTTALVRAPFFPACGPGGVTADGALKVTVTNDGGAHEASGSARSDGSSGDGGVDDGDDDDRGGSEEASTSDDNNDTQNENNTVDSSNNARVVHNDDDGDVENSVDAERNGAASDSHNAARAKRAVASERSGAAAAGADDDDGITPQVPLQPIRQTLQLKHTYTEPHQVSGRLALLALVNRRDAWRVHEYIEYHRLLGVEHVFMLHHAHDNDELFGEFFDNDVHQVLQPYIDEGYMTVVRWPVRIICPAGEWFLCWQQCALQSMLRGAAQRYEWLLVSDTDEFVFVHDRFIDVMRDVQREHAEVTTAHTTGSDTVDGDAAASALASDLRGSLLDDDNSGQNSRHNLLHKMIHTATIDPLFWQRLPSTDFNGDRCNVGREGDEDAAWARRRARLTSFEFGPYFCHDCRTLEEYRRGDEGGPVAKLRLEPPAQLTAERVEADGVGGADNLTLVARYACIFDALSCCTTYSVTWREKALVNRLYTEDVWVHYATPGDISLMPDGMDACRVDFISENATSDVSAGLFHIRYGQHARSDHNDELLVDTMRSIFDEAREQTWRVRQKIDTQTLRTAVLRIKNTNYEAN